MAEAVEQHPYHHPYHWCGSQFHRYVREQCVARMTPFLTGRSVLDVGCGDGHATALIGMHASVVHGIDMNERAIAFAKLIVDDPRISFEVGTAGELADAANQIGEVTAITALEIFEHLDEPERSEFLSQSRSILGASGGALLLSTPNGRRSTGDNPFHAQEFSAELLSETLEAGGFRIRAMQGVYLKPPSEKIEHFANTVPFRPIFRALARAGKSNPDWCRTLVCAAVPDG